MFLAFPTQNLVYILKAIWSCFVNMEIEEYGVGASTDYRGIYRKTTFMEMRKM